MKVPFGRPIIDENETKAVLETLAGHVLVHGDQTKELEQEFARFTGAASSLTLSSCTAGLHLSHFIRNLAPGDEVIVPAQTHVATVHAVEFCGAKPVFADAELETGNIDIDSLESLITENTKAISVVHFLGMPVDMDRVNAIAQKHGLYVIEDCALSFGAKYKGVHTGLLGDAGLFSCYPVKHMTTIEGGFYISKHAEDIEKVRLAKAFGVDRSHSERKVPGEYDVVSLGYNYRMNEVQAAIGRQQLKKLPGFLDKRRSNTQYLRKLVSDMDEISLFKEEGGDFISSHYCFTILLNKHLKTKRFEVAQHLKEFGVGTSVYYPRPVSSFTYYRDKYGHKDGSFPGAERISYEGIALPIGPHLDEEHMDHIAKVLKDSVGKVK